MRSPSSHRVLRWAAVAAVAAFASVAGFGTAFAGGGAMAAAPACASRGHTAAACPMDAAAHLRSWEAAFRSVPPRRVRPAAIPPARGAGRAAALAVAPVAAPAEPRSGPPATPPLFVRLARGGRLQRRTYG